ncbi:MAG TPA: MscL family protein [Streptosporangiaceae bacterium]|nr:MscL family protein [Streptosporangiaceae bacterium]
MRGFRTFLMRGNLIDLAVAFVVGAAFASMVKDFATSFIGPLLAVFGGKPDFTRLAFTINDTRFPYGIFLTSATAFLITSVIVYFVVVLPVSRFLALLDRHQEQSERDCPECMSAIPMAARRCKFCTAQVVPATETPG